MSSRLVMLRANGQPIAEAEPGNSLAEPGLDMDHSALCASHLK